MADSQTVIDIILKATNKTKQALTAPIHDLEDLKGALKGSSLLWTGMATAAATATYQMVKGGIDAAESMGAMSKTVGVGTAALSTLVFAAEQSEVSVDDLGKGLKVLGISI